jgi:hypothetical protein
MTEKKHHWRLPWRARIILRARRPRKRRMILALATTIPSG